MLGLTPLGAAISLVAVAAGIWALARDSEITPRNRLPLGAPLVANAKAPELKAVAGALFVLFLIGAGLQVRRLRASSRPMAV